MAGQFAFESKPHHWCSTWYFVDMSGLAGQATIHGAVQLVYNTYRQNPDRVYMGYISGDIL